MIKYKRLLAMITASVMLLCTLSGCTKEQQVDAEYIGDKDSQFQYQVQGRNVTMAESEKGYYFLSGDYLYYADKSKMKPVILCNKPNCLHDEETDETKTINCNACFPRANSVAYYNGSIYVCSDIMGKSDQKSELIKLSPDGTTRKTVVKLEFSPQSLTIHRGKAYYNSSVYKKDGTSVYGISEFDLEKNSSSPQKLYEGVLSDGNIQDIICYKDNLYFTEFGTLDGVMSDNVIRVDLLTNKSSVMLQEKTQDNFVEQTGGITFLNDNLYYHCSMIDKSNGTINSSKQMKSNLDGTNAEESFKRDLATNAYSDGKYMFIYDLLWQTQGKPKEEKSLKIADENGNPYSSIKIGDFGRTAKIIRGGNQHFFIENSTEDGMYQLLYADKKDIESGKVKLKPFFEIDESKQHPGYITKS